MHFNINQGPENVLEYTVFLLRDQNQVKLPINETGIKVTASVVTKIRAKKKKDYCDAVYSTVSLL